MSELKPRWSWLRIERKTALTLLAIYFVIGLWQGNAVFMAILADGKDTPWPRPFLWELTGALTTFVLSWLPMTAAKNARSPRQAPLTFFVVHAAAFALYTPLHSALMIVERQVLYALLGWGSYVYKGTEFRLLMEAHKDLISYIVIAAGFGLVTSWQESRRKAIRDAQLETELKTAQLQALQAKLDPHFLFNSLNTISSVMYSDLGKTDRLLTDLGLVLRASLDSGASPTWTLAEERAHTEHYLTVMLARFGDRLAVSWSVDEPARAAHVPRFALQLLVENALKHNLETVGQLQVSIAARRENGRVELEVRDNGRGFPAGEMAGGGIGLSTLRRALELCHGPDASLTLGNAQDGGARVQVSLPAREARA